MDSLSLWGDRFKMTVLEIVEEWLRLEYGEQYTAFVYQDEIEAAVPVGKKIAVSVYLVNEDTDE
jgi:hypothetical protein